MHSFLKRHAEGLRLFLLVLLLLYQMLMLVVAGLYGAFAYWTYWALNSAPATSTDPPDVGANDAVASAMTAEPALT